MEVIFPWKFKMDFDKRSSLSIWKNRQLPDGYILVYMKIASKFDCSVDPCYCVTLKSSFDVHRKQFLEKKTILHFSSGFIRHSFRTTDWFFDEMNSTMLINRRRGVLLMNISPWNYTLRTHKTIEYLTF